MLNLLWLVPTFPLAGFVILVFFGGLLRQRIVPFIGVGSVAASAIIAWLVAAAYINTALGNTGFNQVLWHWITVTGMSIDISLYLDSLSLLMMLVVTSVAFLIHLYSAAFMAEDEGYARFFTYMNLFVAMMLLLVLAGNLLLLYVGWEGVGLCSYLLIGFWYQDSNNGLAARKAFIMTRAGDTAMLIGLVLIFSQLGIFNIQSVLQLAATQWPVNSTIAVAVALLLLGGAVGKSAQLPLQTWLPDAMAGPTPVSALIHAATMVTAGVYLIARMHGLFALAPSVQLLVAIIGAVTLLLAGFSALVQTDIKRVLAYSTMSQIGYMFLALGVGAWAPAMFHFMTHAFFKALLFLAAGVVIINLHHEHDIHKMGGLRKPMPVTFWTFVIGASALAALPLVTAGFYSKDLILLNAWAFPGGGIWLWLAGIAGALLTSLYIFRVVFIVFFGEVKIKPRYGDPGPLMFIPIVTLAALSIGGGLIPLPWAALHEPAGVAGLWLKIIAALVSLIGIYVAYQVFLRKVAWSSAVMQWPGTSYLYHWWQEGWRFDALYDRLFVRPFIYVARVNRNDIVDAVYSATAWLNIVSHKALSRTQTGHVRLYAAGIVSGAVILLGISLLL
jgi:NADH-quinone oxidoreductase subunit L